MKAVFHGVIESNLIFPYPKMEADENRLMILESIRRFADTYIDPERSIANTVCRMKFSKR